MSELHRSASPFEEATRLSIYWWCCAIGAPGAQQIKKLFRLLAFREWAVA